MTALTNQLLMPPGPDRSGKPTRRHPLSTYQRFQHLAVTSLGLAGGAGLIGAGIWHWYFAYRIYGPAVVWRHATPWLIAGGLLGLIGLAGLLQVWRWRRTAVVIYPDGLVYRRGGQSWRISWPMISELYLHSTDFGLPGLTWSRRIDITLALHDGRTVTFPAALQDTAGLAEHLKAELFPGLSTEFTRRFNLGEALSFGPLTLTSEGLIYQRNRASWHSVRNVFLAGGRMHIELHDGRRSRRVSIPIGTIPNIDLCVQFIQHLGQPT
jgi:hypothetical protein